jgi:hypothetical protein
MMTLTRKIKYILMAILILLRKVLMLDVNSRGNCNVKNLFTHWVIIIFNVIGKCKY